MVITEVRPCCNSVDSFISNLCAKVVPKAVDAGKAPAEGEKKEPEAEKKEETAEKKDAGGLYADRCPQRGASLWNATALGCCCAARA